MKLPKFPHRKSGTFQTFTDGKPGNTFVVTPGGTIHVRQPIELTIGNETHTFVLTNVEIRWVS